VDYCVNVPSFETPWSHRIAEGHYWIKHLSKNSSEQSLVNDKQSIKRSLLSQQFISGKGKEMKTSL